MKTEKNNYNFNEIPSELRNLPQWILWRYETRKGKVTKVPYQPNGEEAMSNNPRTWSTFATAVKFYLEQNFDGIGFVFSRRDNYIGIDIDDCVVDGQVNNFAAEIIEDLDSYTEFSVSGEGIHIIISGKLPQAILGTGRKNPKLGLEIYSYGRYFCFTGNRENSNNIFERTDEIAELFEKHFDDSEVVERINLNDYSNDEIKLSNDELWEKMFRSKNGDEIKSLFDGNLKNNDWSSSDLSLCNHLAFWTGNSVSRMDSMFRESGLMRAKWDVVHYSTGETHGERTISTAISSTTTTILDKREEESFFSFHSADAAGELPSKKFLNTEMGNAERISYEYGNVIRHVHEVGWYIWDNKRWKVDKRREIERITSKTLRKLFKSEDENDNKWAKVCEKRAVRMNSIKDLASLVPAEREDFDQHPYLFNVQNGIIDLKNGSLLQHDRELMLTKISPVQFENNAQCPSWVAFLESIFKDENGETDYALIEFIQKAIGYSLTADISEQVVFFLWGKGKNGKSTFINTVKNLLGDYGKQTNTDTFIKKKNDSGVNNDVARLANTRFVSAVESEEGQQLNESLIKQLTGGEPITARFLRQEFFEFLPEFKVFFVTNHKPIIKGIDEGIWRRIRMIPFTVTIPAEKMDKKLSEKLSLEMPGILNWAIEGCLKWQSDGLQEPKSIENATSSYKEEMDIVGPFLDETCLINPLARVEAKTLYTVYSNWCAAEGDYPLKNRSFYRMLENKGLRKERGPKNKIYIFGLKLNDEYERRYGNFNKNNNSYDEGVTKGLPNENEGFPFKLT